MQRGASRDNNNDAYDVYRSLGMGMDDGGMGDMGMGSMGMGGMGMSMAPPAPTATPSESLAPSRTPSGAPSGAPSISLAPSLSAAPSSTMMSSKKDNLLDMGMGSMGGMGKRRELNSNSNSVKR